MWREIDIAKSIEYREIFEITSYINNVEYRPEVASRIKYI